jgi:hypothetical protein
MPSSCLRERQNECSSARHLLEGAPWIQVYVADGEETSSSVQRVEAECRTVGNTAENAPGEDVSITEATPSTRSSRRTFALQTPEGRPSATWQSAALPLEPSTNPEPAMIVEVDGHNFFVYEQLRSTRARNLCIASGVALFVVLGMVILPAVLFGVVIVRRPT